MKPARAVVLSLLAGVLAGAPPLLAQEQPLVVGEGGVPVPKKTKVVKPVYPAEALAQGLRGIVILDLLIDATGHVASTTVVRSVPGLDEAAIAAARQWEYEPTRVAGKAVSVRMTVPITFTLALPPLARDSGIPELRQGASPAFPKGAQGGGSVAAELTLEGDGRVGAARIVEGNEPWAGALLAALQTWRFSPPPEDASVSFRVEADFLAARGSEPQRIALKATGLQRSDLLAETTPPAAAPPAATPPAAAPTQTAAGPASPPAPATAPAAAPTPAAAAPQPAAAAPTGDTARPAGQPAAPATTATPAPAAAPPATAPAPATPGAVPVPAPATATPPGGAAAPTLPGAAPVLGNAAAADRGAPPPVEVITAPPPAQPPENGVSAIRDVTLEPGVPDLTRGRRPVTPPLARMGGATGTVEVAFSVSAAGTTLVGTVTGPDLLKKAAEQAVASWVFRRTRADRAYLTAIFTYGPDKTVAVVRPQPAPTASAGPAAGPAVPVAAPASAPTVAPAPATALPATAAPPTPTPATDKPPAATPPSPPSPPSQPRP